MGFGFLFSLGQPQGIAPTKLYILPMGQPQGIAPTKFGGKLTTRIVYKKGLDREGVREDENLISFETKPATINYKDCI